MGACKNSEFAQMRGAGKIAPRRKCAEEKMMEKSCGEANAGIHA
jgi:hypothetical protein